MDPVHIEAVELDEQLWQKWFQKRKVRDQARKRRCRSLVELSGGILLLVIAILRSFLPS
jgi:hypothetical protein